MRRGQPNSTALLKWNSAASACLVAACVALTSCSDPSQGAAGHGAAAQQALDAGDIVRARREITEAIVDRDDLPELFLLKGRIELAAGSEKKAYAAYANALSLDNADIEALQAVSQLGLRTGNLRESLDATERLLALQPGDPNALVVRGVHFFLQRRFTDAIEFADRALASQPGNEGAIILKSRSLFLSGEQQKALQVIEGVSSATAGIARTKLELYRELRNAPAMQEQFSVLHHLAPEDWSLRIDEADLQYKLGNIDAGRQDIAGVLSAEKLDDESARSALNVLRAYADAPTADQVRDVARAGSKDARTELARYLISMNLPVLAGVLVERMEPTVAKPLIAQVEVLRNHPEKALTLSRQVLSSDETNCDALVASAAAFLKGGNSTAALRNSQRGAAECPDRSESWLLSAKAYAARNEPVNVERVFRDALDSNPQSLRITIAFGDWLRSRGRLTEAQAIARLLTRKSPALMRAWAYYRGLCDEGDSDCKAEASRGYENAKTLFGPDEDVTKLPPGGLFGRLVRR